MPEKLLTICGKPFVEPVSNFLEIVEVSLCERVPQMSDSQMEPGMESTTAVEECPIQAISRCLSLVLLCETAHSGRLSIKL